jgi:glycosyltransferase involved in cell wall biosynthesis
MGTTPAIERIFRDCGFVNTVTLSLPPGIDAEAFPAEPAPFQRLLYAGAARADKGFGAIVDLVAHLAAIDATVPFTVQTSGDHYGRYDPATRTNVERLNRMRYPPLSTLPDPIMPKEYAALFPGSISLQPYQRNEYASKMSAITLDSLSAGCPVVTVAGTSMAGLVERFQAGAVVDEPSPEALWKACRTLIADYPRYRENARAGGEQMRRENSWAPLVSMLRGD